jgi:non-ribosomal peptide synthetase component E (peptide arylation enzyme)
MVVKHVEATDIYYVDLAPVLGTGETVSSVTSVTPTDATITVTGAAVISENTTVTKTIRDQQGNTDSVVYVVAANKGALFQLAGGTTGLGSSKVTVKFVKSTGKTDAVDCLIEVAGVKLA